MKLIKELALAGTKNGKITVGIVEEPYGKESASIASIAISLSAKNTEPDWKIHLPKENIDEVIAALTEAKKEL